MDFPVPGTDKVAKYFPWYIKEDCIGKRDDDYVYDWQDCKPYQRLKEHRDHSHLLPIDVKVLNAARRYSANNCWPGVDYDKRCRAQLARTYQAPPSFKRLVKSSGSKFFVAIQMLRDMAEQLRGIGILSQFGRSSSFVAAIALCSSPTCLWPRASTGRMHRSSSMKTHFTARASPYLSSRLGR